MTGDDAQHGAGVNREDLNELLDKFRTWQNSQDLPSSGLTDSGWAFKQCADALETVISDAE